MTDPRDEPDGYRPAPPAAPGTGRGPVMRSDIIDVYVFRRPRGRADVIEFLQLLRTGEPMGGTWQPVMGHIEAGETAPQTARRELLEEVGLAASDAAMLGLWALEQVHPYYIAAIECIVLSPRFAAEVDAAWEPTLNHEHSARRWIAMPVEPELANADARRGSLAPWFWPGQRACVLEILHEIVNERSLSRERLRLR